jgi:hypothetical protein
VNTVLRVCRTCGQGKGPSEYYQDSRYPNGDIHCAECRRIKVREWVRTHPDQAKAISLRTRTKNAAANRNRARQWYLDNRPRALEARAIYRRENARLVKSGKLRAAFGITLEQYENMASAQDHRCLICGIHQGELRRSLAVDHCHATSKVRGLICSQCNRGLGSFKDSPSILMSAANYLKKYT